MQNIITSAKHFGLLVLALAFFLPSTVLANNAENFDDEPEPGCETVVSLNDFL